MEYSLIPQPGQVYDLVIDGLHMQAIGAVNSDDRCGNCIFKRPDTDPSCGISIIHLTDGTQLQDGDVPGCLNICCDRGEREDELCVGVELVGITDPADGDMYVPELGALCRIDVPGNDTVILKVQRDSGNCDSCYFSTKDVDDNGSVMWEGGRVVSNGPFFCSNVACEAPAREDRTGIIFVEQDPVKAIHDDIDNMLSVHQAEFMKMMVNQMIDSLQHEAITLAEQEREESPEPKVVEQEVFFAQDPVGKVLNVNINGDSHYIEVKENDVSCNLCIFNGTAGTITDNETNLIKRGGKVIVDGPPRAKGRTCSTVACAPAERADGKSVIFSLAK